MFVKQVAPNLEDLTSRRTQVNALTAGYPTGAWADESRDYHVAVRLSAKSVGQEQLAARVQVALGEEVQTQALVKATWTNDEALTTRIDDQVARYTGKAELAQMIQDGLAAKAAGRDDDATSKLGRAVQLANEAGDQEMTSRLRKVVDIDNAETGTVRLKKGVERLDEMALDTASTKTTRVRK
jgi:von Willebrand factor type A C-terminal domain